MKLTRQFNKGPKHRIFFSLTTDCNEIIFDKDNWYGQRKSRLKCLRYQTEPSQNVVHVYKNLYVTISGKIGTDEENVVMDQMTFENMTS